MSDYFSQQRRRNFLASDYAIIGNGHIYSNFNKLIPTFQNCVLQTLDEVAYVEGIQGKLIIEVIIPKR